MTRRLWTRDEQVRALELYLRTPFGRIHAKNPEIVALASQLGRSTNALALKMVNFAALDPTIPQKGMGNYSKSDEAIWAEFFAAPSSFIETIANTDVPAKFSGDYELTPRGKTDFEFEVREGHSVKSLAKTRTNQNYFRKMLMVSYEEKCALTGIDRPELLIASHIKPWKDDVEARLDPRNGILLNALHDRAFDSGLITFNDDMTLVPSRHLDLPSMAVGFFKDRKLSSPTRFAPDPSYLRYHREVIFRDSVS